MVPNFQCTRARRRRGRDTEYEPGATRDSVQPRSPTDNAPGKAPRRARPALRSTQVNIKEYVVQHGVEKAIADVATHGVMWLLGQLAPGRGECLRLVAQGKTAFNEATVMLSNGYVRRDFPVRERLADLLAREDEVADGCVVEGEDFRWQWLAVTDGAYRWRLRTYEGPEAEEALVEERAERAREGQTPMDESEEDRYFVDTLRSETFKQWRHLLAEDAQWPHAVEPE